MGSQSGLLIHNTDLLDPNFYTHGLYTKRTINTLSSSADVQQTSPMTLPSPMSITQANKHHVKSETPDYDKYRPYYKWGNTVTIRDTFNYTTQKGVSIDTFPTRKRHLKSRNPALNVPYAHEAVATDTVYSDTPAVDSGVKWAQLFVGKESIGNQNLIIRIKIQLSGGTELSRPGPTPS